MCDSGIDIPFVSENEGELSIFFHHGTVANARSILEKYLPTFGNIQTLRTENETSIACEFFDIRHSGAAAESLNGRVIDDVAFYVSFKDADLSFRSSSSGSDVTTSSTDSKHHYRTSSLSAHAPVFESVRATHPSTRGFLADRSNRLPESYSEPPSPLNGYSYDLLSDLPQSSGSLLRRNSYENSLSRSSYGGYGQSEAYGAPVGRGGRRMPLSDWNDPEDTESYLTFQVERASESVVRNYSIFTSATVPKNNVVDLERIARGLDTRTTLMLRNIPNKVDQRMLKDYIDVTNKNTYDFLYLRIDFLNKCNVGYAFISFTSPEAIITFAKARAGTKWFGKECLIEKFRNSSVMDQDEAYRPKIFFSDGPLKGQEEDFPPPNNLNRKLRSIASIQQIGKDFFRRAATVEIGDACLDFELADF
ncbi:RNA recognition motif 2-domain-containing protein [Limtongia smithiae]|uniref:RNA recognition motif 2-domain-containing protein n=1 Tax=Limtongia smithiae TaxID=1125753 RepID=UPI0034CD79C6